MVVRCAFRMARDSQEVAQFLIFPTMQPPTWNLELGDLKSGTFNRGFPYTDNQQMRYKLLTGDLEA